MFVFRLFNFIPFLLSLVKSDYRRHCRFCFLTLYLSYSLKLLKPNSFLKSLTLEHQKAKAFKSDLNANDYNFI